MFTYPRRLPAGKPFWNTPFMKIFKSELASKMMTGDKKTSLLTNIEVNLCKIYLMKGIVCMY